ncbi:ATP-binding protein [Kitasatospora sp. NPDC089797]|uniref:HD domain-containing protein n=1 Tax=Kitasatospora sp. NPDC089797 TaxID=3155298 RepID=UPI003444233B
MASETRNVMTEVTVGGSAVQAEHIENLYLGHPPAENVDDVRCVAESRVWRHVRADRDPEPYRRVALAAVRELARLRDEAQPADDPWQDPGVADRFAERVGWLLGDQPLDLYPAEAALLVVLPYLYRVRSLQLAATRTAVRPIDLRPADDPDGDRVAYEQFIESHDLLAHRARTRPDAGAPIGWWLFHRWLAQYEDLADPDGVTELLDQLPMLAELGETFSPRRVCALLHGLRRGPDVGNRDYLAGLSADDHLRAPGEQHVREPRVALLLALAYGTAIEMTVLPEIVAEHLGIPHEVDLVELRHTLEQAVWGGSYDLPVLRAECHHEAVVEGLREYTARADELLHAVRRVLTDHPLPTRLTSDGAAPAAGAFTGWARFRLDERRVRSLLMGVELYRDRDLAVRELYQNALDACRYRRARTEYLDRTNPLATYSYEGRIEFRQDVDEDGRAYLECQDNGVGMGEAELRGVFSNAGARFAEQLDFKLERAEWRKTDPPVELYPNSRFGIGVLSYFMLADEIQVTTCRMDATGQLGPLLDVSIYGPSHLFRIVECSNKGRGPGTTIRLYLRDDIDLGRSWSALDVLERLLGIAEFDTTAVHGERTSAWPPQELRAREAPQGEDVGFSAGGRLAPWTAAPEGAQVVWCQYGGSLLIDGLAVEPELVRGVFSRGHGGLTGAVVNLSGELAPGKMSVDRRRVISDLAPAIQSLLEVAVGELVSGGSDLVTLEWIQRIADDSLFLADLVAAEIVRNGMTLWCGGVAFDTSRTGVFLADIEMFTDPARDEMFRSKLTGDVPDHVLLWRLMARGGDWVPAEIVSLCPEVSNARVRTAMPSDLAVLASRSRDRGYRSWRGNELGDEWILNLAAELETTLEEARARAAGLGVRWYGMGSRRTASGENRATITNLLVLADINDMSVADAAAAWIRGGRTVEQEILSLAIAADSDPVFLWKRTGKGRFWSGPQPGGSVESGHIAKAARVLGMSVDHVCSAIGRYGIGADGSGLPQNPTEELVQLLSRDLDGEAPWLSRAVEVPAIHLLRAVAKLGTDLARIAEMLLECGFRLCTIPKDASVADLYLFNESQLTYDRLFELAGGREIGLAAVVDRYRAYGFDLPMVLPSTFTRLDTELFFPDSAMNWKGLRVAEAIPFARVILAARVLHRSPRSLVQHLNSRGLSVSCDDLPAGLTLDEAVELFRSPISGDVSERWGKQRTLVGLLGLSRRTGHSMSQIATWLREWGVDVPDLAETIRAALARVPMADPS